MRIRSSTVLAKPLSFGCFHCHELVFFLFSASELFRVKQITETILSNARATKQATGEKLKQPRAYLTEYEKHGGPKQAYRDFKLFRAQERQDFLLPGGVCEIQTS